MFSWPGKNPQKVDETDKLLSNLESYFRTTLHVDIFLVRVVKSSKLTKLKRKGGEFLAAFEHDKIGRQ